VKKTKVILSLFLAFALALSVAASLRAHQLETEMKQVIVEYEQLDQEKRDIQELNDELLQKQEELLQMQEELKQRTQELKGKNQALQESLHESDNKIQHLKQDIDALKKSLEQKKQELARKGSWKTFTATYYDANYQSTGKSPGDKGYGITASGKQVKSGVTVAVDPAIIPLGTWLEIKYPDGRIEKRRADDTGSAIKGKEVDIYVPKATLAMGRHEVEVRVLN
jgi:3D (Asp-Asp-Asp) domain-containing protein